MKLVFSAKFFHFAILSAFLLLRDVSTNSADQMYGQVYDRCGLLWHNYHLASNAVHSSDNTRMVGRGLVDGHLKSGQSDSTFLVQEGLKVAHHGEVKVREYQILTNPFGVQLQWVTGHIPKNAIVAGTSSGYAVYIGETTVEGTTYIGHIVEGGYRLWYTRGDGNEYSTGDYRILVSVDCPVAEKMTPFGEETPSYRALELAQHMYDLKNEQCGLVWQSGYSTSIPPNAVYAGKETKRSLYVARSLNGGQLKVAKLVDGGSGTSAMLNSKEFWQRDYQVLINPKGIALRWIAGPSVPPNAIVAGNMYGAQVYIGRAGGVGNTRLGYLYPSRDSKLWFGVYGEVFTTEKWEILTATNCHTVNVKPEFTFAERPPSAKAQQVAQTMYDKQLRDQCGLVWAPTNRRSAVPNAVSAGRENGAAQLYIARAMLAGKLKPGKFIVRNSMYLAFGKQEVSRSAYQVLTNPHSVSLTWAPGPSIPPTAIVGGSIEGKPVYIGRLGDESNIRLGYLYPAGDGQLRFSIYGHSYTSADFQVLVAPQCGGTVNGQKLNTSGVIQDSEYAQHVAEYMYETKLHDKCGLVWKTHSGTNAVPSAVNAGKDANSGRQVSVARSVAHGQLVPGRFIDAYGMFFVHLGNEIKAKGFAVLTNPDDVPLKWVNRNGTTIPATAVVAGSIAEKPVFIGRTQHKSNTVVGYLYPTKDSKLVYSMFGEVFTSHKYDILLAPNCD